METDNMIKLEPYSLSSNEKEKIFLECMQQSIQFHYNNCDEYKDFCVKKNLAHLKNIRWNRFLFFQ